MKDTLITAHRKLVELKTAGVCLLLAILVNIGCIIYYHTPFYEVFTTPTVARLSKNGISYNAG